MTDKASIRGRNHPEASGNSCSFGFQRASSPGTPRSSPGPPNCRPPVRSGVNKAPGEQLLSGTAQPSSVDHQLPSVERQLPSLKRCLPLNTAGRPPWGKEKPTILSVKDAPVLPGAAPEPRQHSQGMPHSTVLRLHVLSDSRGSEQPPPYSRGRASTRT